VEDGLEVLAFDDASGSLLAVGGDAQYIFQIGGDGLVELAWREVFNRSGDWTPTSIAVDPAGRGFAVSAWVPSPVDAAEGMVQFVDIAARRLIWQMPAGVHPDSVAFAPDGRFLVIANEGEPGAGNEPGGLTLVDLSAIEDLDDLPGLNESEHYGFNERTLADPSALARLRISAKHLETPATDIEPEYLAPTHGGVWVSLQENNALAYFDLGERRWTRTLPLGTLSFPFDANDEDGIDIFASEGFALLHEPDTIRLIEYADRQVLLLANEGEQDDEDVIRFGDALRAGLLDPAAVERIKARYGDPAARLGRLTISMIDGDLDGDGDIDIPTAIGGRSISLVDADTGVTLWNSGPQIEMMTARLYPERYNAGDARSDKGGPEPEGLAVGRINGRTLAFVGLERTDVIMMYDISDPLAPRLLATQRLESACSSPEGLVFIDDGERWFLGVASEEDGCLSSCEVHIGG